MALSKWVLAGSFQRTASYVDLINDPRETTLYFLNYVGNQDESNGRMSRLLQCKSNLILFQEFQTLYNSNIVRRYM